MRALRHWLGLGACCIGAGVFAPVPVPVREPVNPVSGNNGFTVMVERDATLASGGNEGTLAIGGDLVLAGDHRVALATAGSHVVSGDTRPTALVVGGRVAFGRSAATGRVAVLSRGHAKIGSLAGSVVMDTDDSGVPARTRVNATGDYEDPRRVELSVRQPAASVGPATVFDFRRLFGTYRERAAALAECGNNVVLRDATGRPFPGGTVPPGSTVRIGLTRGVTNVVRTTGRDLAAIARLVFGRGPTAASPLLVVVDTTAEGGVLTWVPPVVTGIGGKQARFVLFDFPDAVSITMPPGRGGTVKGTIYAPDATLTDTNPAGIDGNVIVGSLVQGGPGSDGGRIRDLPFGAVLDCPAAARADARPPSGGAAVRLPSGGAAVRWKRSSYAAGRVPGAAVRAAAAAPGRG
ncbi:collagen-binding domain-containing protein [Streptosporangium sandarakinum]|uniref:collagen-binding domain-containing protein n=1 Tax=Streptosporangium sandarakinum TaxID=1260955 RepID=UPI003D93EA12